MITHFKNDTSPSLTDTIKVNGAAFDLTGSTVTFNMRPENSPTMKVNASAAVVVSAAAGTVRFDWGSADVDTDDLYVCWWDVTLPSGKHQKTPSFVLRIDDKDPTQVTNYINREDLKDTIAMTGTTFADKDVDRAIAAACRGIDQACGRRFYPDPDATHVRYYTPTDMLTLPIGDLITLTSFQTDMAGTGAFSTSWTQNTDFALEPFNAAEAEAGIVRPYNRIRVLPRMTALRLYGWPHSAKVTGQWGWATPPEPVKQAAGLLAGRLLIRARQAPLGVMALPDLGEVARIARSDPDIAFLLGPFIANALIA